jgi:hypothetical protein
VTVLAQALLPLVGGNLVALSLFTAGHECENVKMVELIQATSARYAELVGASRVLMSDSNILVQRKN